MRSSVAHPDLDERDIGQIVRQVLGVVLPANEEWNLPRRRVAPMERQRQSPRPIDARESIYAFFTPPAIQQELCVTPAVM